MHRKHSCGAHSLHASYEDFQESSHRCQLKPMLQTASEMWPLMQSRNGLILFVLLHFVLMKKPDCQAPFKDPWVRARELQRQLQGGPQPAHAAGTHVCGPVYGREMGRV